MGKINKYSNIYDREGNKIRSVNNKGVLEDMTMKEVQDLVDKLGTEKDENGIKDPQAFNNASAWLMQMYNNPKYSKEKENFIKELNDRLRVNKEEVGRSLEELDKEVLQENTTETGTSSKSEGIRLPKEDRTNKEPEVNDKSAKSYDVNDNEDEYVEYEEVKDGKKD